jgi:two-component system, chemotaxis family, sensor kinase CheA
MIDDFLEQYKDEAREVLKSLEQSVLVLEKKGDVGEINNAYRYLHTLKGGSAMFGFQLIERLAHELENIFGDIRDGLRVVDTTVLDVTLEAIDLFTELLEGKDAADGVEHLLSVIHQLGQRSGPDHTRPTDSGRAYLVIIKAESDFFKRGIRLEAILDEINELGDCKTFIHNEVIPLAEQLTSKQLSSWFEIYVPASCETERIKDVFLFMKPAEYHIQVIQNANDLHDSPLAEYITLSDEGLRQRLDAIAGFEQPRQQLPQPMEEMVLNLPDVMVKPSAEVRDTPQRSSVSGVQVNVAAQKLDQLINIVSELVIFRSELQHILQSNGNGLVDQALEKFERLTIGLRDTAFNIRLVPLTVLEVKLQRLVRTVSKELGKEVEFITEGLHTELDRGIIAALEAPLMHIIRNAIDHGIETPAEREVNNKPRKGVVKLYSYNSGDHVFIQLQDDGKGISFAKIRERALARGLIKAGVDYSEKELINLMMMPGFSTAERITSISGRGVGMDVVRKEIHALRGDLEVATEEGLGSIFTIRLPLTLTILDTLVVKVAANKYLIPVNEVERCFKDTHNNLFKRKGRFLDYNGDFVPVVSLREEFREVDFPEEETVILVNKNDRRIAVVVDSILGTLQTVYKPLNELLHPADCFSGASILGDGSMALIINALKLSN